MASKSFSMNGSELKPPMSAHSHTDEDSTANPSISASGDKIEATLNTTFSILDRTVSHLIEYNRHLMETNQSLSRKIEKLENRLDDIRLDNASLHEKVEHLQKKVESEVERKQSEVKASASSSSTHPAMDIPQIIPGSNLDILPLLQQQLTNLYLNSQLNPMMNLITPSVASNCFPVGQLQSSHYTQPNINFQRVAGSQLDSSGSTNLMAPSQSFVNSDIKTTPQPVEAIPKQPVLTKEPVVDNTKSVKPVQPTTPAIISKATASTDSLMDKFKAKPGSWSCSGCYLTVDGDKTSCPACETLKPGATKSNVTSSAAVSSFGSSQNQTFKFGSAPSAELPTTTKPSGSGFLFGSTSSAPQQSFKFGVPDSSTLSNQTIPTSTIPLSSTSSTPKKDNVPLQTATTSTAAFPTTATGFRPFATDTVSSSSFSFRPPETTSASTTSSDLTFSVSFSKPSFSFGGSSGTLFGNASTSLTKSVFSTTLTDSLQKSTNEVNGGFHFKTADATNTLQSNEDSEDSALHDEGDHIYFKPVLEKLPEKVEVVTGEENDDVIFNERAKLFRWVQGEWKERGLGDMKLLQNKDTGVVRAVMRREHIHKVCCNHCLTSGMQLNPMPGSSAGKSWTWFALDFAESVETPEGTTFAIRFKDVQQAERFQKEFNKAVESRSPVKGTQSKGDNEKSSDDEVVLVSVDLPFVTEDQKARARNLMLRETHFSYENAPGYNPDEDSDETIPKESAIQKSKTQEKTTDEVKEDHLTSFFANFGKEPVQTQKESAKPIETKDNKTVAPIFGSLIQTNEKPMSFADLIKSSSGSGALDKSASIQPFSWTGAGSKLFTSPPAPASPQVEEKQDNESVENEDGAAYDPHYEPIVNLPKIEHHTTGEEEDECLFQQRAKLYRFTHGQWKERGIGTMKVLMRTIDNKITGRLVMRRDQIKKLCCNQQITLHCPDFTPFTSASNAVCWLAIDHSEGTPSTEQLAIKFKEEKDFNAFVSAVSDIQKKLQDS